jgi:sugar O-acyltransferase (sialic acid O-acetyltransferase NeuD family)
MADVRTDRPPTEVSMDPLKELYIIGAGGLGREVADIVESVNQRMPTYRLAGFVDDNKELHGRIVNGIPVLGGRADLEPAIRDREIYAVIAIADTKIKNTIASDLDGVVWTNIIHPTAAVSRYCEMGNGNIVQAFCSVNANARLGDHCTINIGSAIGHDAILGDCVSVMCLCSVNGNTRLGNGVYIGSNGMILPGLAIGADAFICAGSGVFCNVDAGAVMIGNPAKRIR